MSGIYNLGDRAITGALTDEVITQGVSSAGVAQEFIDGLEWMAAATLFVNFTYGSGGATTLVYVRTTLDSVNWIDIARFDFAQVSTAKRANLSGLETCSVAAVAALSGEGLLQGILGDRLQVKVTSTGIYAGNTFVSVRAAVR